MTYDPRLFGFSSTSIPASKLSSVINNSTGITIPKYTPVRIDTSGNMALVDVSIEATALAIVGIVPFIILLTLREAVFLMSLRNLETS